MIQKDKNSREQTKSRVPGDLLNMKIFYLLSLCMFLSCARKSTSAIPLKKELNGPFENVLIHETTLGRPPCEPSISINPKNKNFIVAGSVINNVYTSSNGGKTWNIAQLTSSFGVYGDPVVRYDHKGNVYYSHLANSKGKAYSSVEFLDRIVVQKSSDNGKTWTDGSFPKVDHIKDHDKQWKSIHPETGEILMTWTEFDVYGSAEPNHRSRILFSSSKDMGKTWSDSKSINDAQGDCLDDDYTTEGAHPAFGVDGELYVVWSFDNKIWLDVSYDGGKTWGHDKVIAEQVGGWAFDIPGIKRSNGFPTIKVDHSKGKGRGNIYVQWADQRNGKNNTDILLIKSADQGKTWSDVVTVNDDKKEAHQFFSWMDIDQSNGYVYLVFYDRRQHSDETTDVYLAYSMDNGASFKNVKISAQPFKNIPNVFFGDYNDISVVDGMIRPIWTHQDNQKLSVYTALIQHK